MTPFEGTSTCIETARPLQLLEVLSSVCALVFLSSRSLTSLQTSGGPLTSSRITPDSLLPFVHPPPLSSISLYSYNILYKCTCSECRPIIDRFGSGLSDASTEKSMRLGETIRAPHHTSVVMKRRVADHGEVSCFFVQLFWYMLSLGFQPP